jgi:hypothetical protein
VKTIASVFGLAGVALGCALAQGEISSPTEPGSVPYSTHLDIPLPSATPANGAESAADGYAAFLRLIGSTPAAFTNSAIPASTSPFADTNVLQPKFLRNCSGLTGHG